MLFEKKLQNRVAYLAIGRSSLRNQGVPGLVKTSRDFAASLNLKAMAKCWNELNFDSYLDRKTKALQKKFRKKARNNFGAARKALNLFFRDVVYNTFLRKKYNISLVSKHIEQLELPLDSYTSKKIIKRYPILKFYWGGIKYLSAECSELFQDRATIMAVQKKCARVHLDVFYWREGK
jgi:hypothetical protein